MAELADRLHQIEQRLTALERRERGRSAARLDTAAPSDNSASSGDAFWALNELKVRAHGASAILFSGAVALRTGEYFEWQHGTDAGALLDTDWTPLVDALSALAHPIRLVLLRAVLDGTRTANELSELEDLGTSGQVYHHLRQLVAAGWLHTGKRGHYEIPGARVVPLLVILTAAAR